MKKTKNLSTILYIALFAVFVFGLGVLSYFKLMKYYVNNESALNGYIPGSESRLENDISNSFFDQFDFVNLNGLMARLIGKREVNYIVKMDNGYLNTQIEPIDEEQLKKSADQVIALSDYLARAGIPFIYVVPTTTSAKYDPKMPEGYDDYGNENLDKVASALRDRGVWVIDMRDELAEDGIDAYEMTYKTDHHWNTKMGFYTYCKLVPILERELDCTVDPANTDINSYTVTTYKNWHLGSRGQRTGKFFAGIDDFDLYVPKFETYLESADGTRVGSYTDVLVTTEPLEKKNLTFQREDVNKRSIYDRVLEISQGDYINKKSQNDKHILIIGDSFTKAIFPFMDISFERVRWEFGPAGPEVFEEVQPDAVIMLYESVGGITATDGAYEWTRQ